MLKKTALIVSVFFIYFSQVLGQKLEIGMGTGMTYYKGDLQPTFRLLNPSVGTSTFVRYNLSKSISGKAQAFIGRVTGNDAKSGDVFLKDRGFKFFNDLYDYNAQIEYNFLNFRTHNGRYESKYTPYLFGGLGSYDILRAKYYNHSTLTDSKTNGQLSSNTMINYGIGYKTIIRGKWNFSVDFNTRVLLKNRKTNNTDNFDGLKYIKDDIDAVNYKVTGMPASHYFANTTQKDKYFYLSFSVSYLFYKVHCPPGR